MEFIMRLLFFIAAVSFLLLLLTLAFSVFLIVWPFLAVGLLASVAYAWLSRYRYSRKQNDIAETSLYQTEYTTIIEHEDAQKDEKK